MADRNPPLSPERSLERTLLHAGGRASQWHNFGLWPAQDYASAGQALARAVGVAAQLKHGQRVLSVGCGAGEELRLWKQDFGCRSATGTDAALPDDDSLAFDAIVCVDAAYHFSPRIEWMAGCARRLRPGGTLAYTDLTLQISPGVSPAVRALLEPVFKSAGIAVADLTNAEQTDLRLRNVGFADIQIQDISAAVLDGFCAFERRQRAQLPADAVGRTAWRRVRVTAAALSWLRRCSRWGWLSLGYALISARRDSSASSATTAACAEFTADSSKGTPSSA